MFELHERLKADTLELGSLRLSKLLLMNDSSLPWLIVVPEREGIKEIHELGREDRISLMEEVSEASEVLQRLFKPDKINIGALGNIITQLHVHIIGRYCTDRAWPGPIWGTGPLKPYGRHEAEKRVSLLKEAFKLGL